MQCQLDQSNALTWQPYSAALAPKNAPVLRTNGFDQTQTLAQLVRQPPGSMMLMGPSLAMTQQSNPSNQFNVAWIGPDNFVYQTQLGSQQPVVPSYDCNDYGTTNADGSIARVPTGQCRQCYNNNCCDMTTDMSNNTNIPSALGICNYPVPGNTSQTMNACVGYSTQFCPTSPVNIFASANGDTSA